MAKTKKETPAVSYRQEVKKQAFTLLLGGLSLVAALAWNDAVRSLFIQFFPENGGVLYKFIYAIIVTTIIVWLTIRLKHFLKLS